MKKTKSPKSDLTSASLSEEECDQVSKLLADKCLQFLSYWDSGVYRALSVSGTHMRFVRCSPKVADTVNCAISKRREANANLLAAARDLLSTSYTTWRALDKWATESDPTLEEIADLREQIKSAIAKAEGK